jgi:tRNA (guanine-N7-)-methyltransferase
MGAEHKQILHGRRRGRRLRPRRQALVDGLLPRISLDPEALPSDLRHCFSRPVRAVWLEIGFGGGEHLAAQAAAHPDIGFIGCEPYINGVARLLAEIDAAPASRPLDNIRLLADDARGLLERVPAASLDRVFVLFPDPWPKKRHHQRRFLSPAQLDLLARAMAPNAELRVATDHKGYLRWILQHCTGHPSFRWLAQGPLDWRNPPADWIRTRYEEKARARGEECAYLRFLRIDRMAPESVIS